MARKLYFEEGVNHYNRREYAKAVDCFMHSIIEHNYNPALSWLGQCYEYGLGVPKDLEAAKDLYVSCYDHMTSRESASELGLWLKERIARLKALPESDTLCRFVAGIGNVKVIRRLQAPAEPQLRCNNDEVVVTVQKRCSLYYGLAYAQVRIPEIMSTWTCDGKGRFSDGYTIDAYMFNLKVLRGSTDEYISVLDGRNCTLYFPRNAELGYMYVQQTILDKVRSLLLKRGNAVVPKMLKEVADRLGLTFNECKVVNTVRSFSAINYQRGDLIEFSVAAVQLPKDSFETLCIHELTHNFVGDHSARFYQKMRELGGDKAVKRDSDLFYDCGWPYLKFI